MPDAPFKNVKLKYFGKEVLLVKSDAFDKYYRKIVAGKWEPETFEFLGKHLSPDAIYIDVGSWIGVTPLWASKSAQKVIAVEPEVFCSRVLKHVIDANKASNVTLVNAALCATKKATFFEVGDGGSSISSLVPHARGRTIEVDGISVDEILAMAGNARRVVKIDIEGFEYQLADEICKFAGPELQGLQISVHPTAIAKHSRLPRPFSAIKAAMKTLAFVRRLERAFGPARLTSHSSIASYLLKGVLLRKRARGTELQFSFVNGQPR